MTGGYRELKVWQKAMDLVEEIYCVTRELPRSERFGLVSQMQRCAVSIPSNIAEGYSRTHRGDYLKHLSYARGSLSELETQLEISVRVNCLKSDGSRKAWRLLQEVGKMLTGLIQSLQPQGPLASAPKP